MLMELAEVRLPLHLRLLPGRMARKPLPPRWPHLPVVQRRRHCLLLLQRCRRLITGRMGWTRA